MPNITSGEMKHLPLSDSLHAALIDISAGNMACYFNLPYLQQQGLSIGHLLQVSCCLKLEPQGRNHPLRLLPVDISRTHW
uniref:Uncharacterized protein n=1 Tax=Rhizophora mucronata TaxID=61149 RepID=A0A2P2MIB4_RHIMU